MTISLEPEELPIARVYAEAAWNLATVDQAADEFIEEMDSLVRQVLDSDGMTERFFRAPSISQEDRKGFLDRVFEGRVSELMYNFLSTLNRHNRLGLLRACHAAIHELRDGKRGIVPIEVRSAVELSDEQKSEVEDLARKRFRIEPKLICHVDESLMGGLWIRVGDTVLDKTLKTNLRKLRDTMATRSSYEIQSGRSYFDSPAGN